MIGYMKKILIVLGILLCILTSCVDKPVYKEVDGRQVEIINNDTRYIRYMEFDGHEYVYMSQGYGRSLCHSPKCHCLNKYEN